MVEISNQLTGGVVLEMAVFQGLCDFTSPLVRLAPLHPHTWRRRVLCLVEIRLGGGGRIVVITCQWRFSVCKLALHTGSKR